MDANTVAGLDWPHIDTDLDREGFALLPALLSREETDEMAGMLLNASATRRLASLADLGIGKGEMWRLNEVMTAPLAQWGGTFHEFLAPIADRWCKALGEATSPFLSRGTGMTDGRTCAAGIATRLREGDYQALHHSGGDERFFPIQLVVLLSDPGADFTGGELVMTEHRPRMQSRPMVLPLRKGDAAIIAASGRPIRGNHGYYRGNIKHGVSRVRSGVRMDLTLTFHDLTAINSDGRL